MYGSVVAVALILSAFDFLGTSSPALARPPCRVAPNAPGQNDVTSSLPCRKSGSLLLDFLMHLNLPQFDQFVAANHFLEGQSREQLQITWIGANFRRHFLNKIEGPAPAREFDVYRLKRFAHNDTIIGEIGGEPEVMLHDIWVLLTHQSHGEQGPLQTDARPNLFYVRDSTGLLWAVDTVWGGAGWEVGASRLDEPRQWDAQIEVITR